jgi:hypothetical protein
MEGVYDGVNLEARQKLKDMESGKVKLRFWGRKEFVEYTVKHTYKKHLTTTEGKLMYKDIAEYKFVEESDEESRS